MATGKDGRNLAQSVLLVEAEMNEIVKKFDNKFAASHGTTELTADEWFVIRDEITKLKKQVEQLQWQLREQD